MKKIGVIRRIDNLGRIVVPKEMRKVLHISEGDTLELNIIDENIVINKYSTIGSLDKIFNLIINMLGDLINCNILVTDLEKVVCCNKDINNLYCGKLISNFCYDKIIHKNKYLSTEIVDINLISDMIQNSSIYLVPLLSSYDPVGSIIVFSDNVIDKKTIDCCDKVVNFINKYNDE